MRDEPVGLADAGDASRFGGKASHLAAAIAAGLPVPEGFALTWSFVDRVVSGDAAAREALVAAFARLGAHVAVRSSAVGEDSARASFAGVHVSVLNVRDAERLIEAVREVRDSGGAEGALAYRASLGADAEPRVGIVVQALLEPDISGILFTRHPVTGADERVIEAAWGLGEAIVGGLVTPDHVRMSRAGELIAQRIGDKDLMIRALPDGGTEEVALDTERASAPCLDAQHLAQLAELATRCENAFGPRLDLEWCFEGDRLYLLQQRPLTA